MDRRPAGGARRGSTKGARPASPATTAPARAPTRLDLTRPTLQRPGWCVPMTSQLMYHDGASLGLNFFEGFARVEALTTPTD